MKRYIREFKEFAVKGNVVDLAVAVIIGGAFGKIVSSLVADVVMPLIGLIIGGVDFAAWKIALRPGVTMNIGAFVQNVFDFIIIALVIFVMVKIIGRLKKQLIKEEAKGEVAPPPLTKDQELLGEIRDLLKK
ncbi:MAG: large-conductance mechanosensitive channel protein MscL [Patescibacteria group bacterium]